MPLPVTKENLEACIEVSVSRSIETNVNGKIDMLRNEINTHNILHENDMKRILPVVEAFEASKTSGKIVLWVAGTITAVGGAILILMRLFGK